MSDKSDGKGGEIVDGARAAARILNAMDSERRKRIMAAVQKADPQIFSQIHTNIFVFEDLENTTSQGLQHLIKEIEYRDLVIALGNSSEAIRNAFYGSMSERRQRMLRDDIESLPAQLASEADEAKERITKRADRLREAGLLRSESSDDVWV